MFYAQWTVVQYKGEFIPNEYNCFAGTALNYTDVYDWLVLETVVFYIYILSCAVYIAKHIIVEWVKKDEALLDARKQLTDFIIYKEKSLEWFAMNFVNLVAPVFFGILVLRSDIYIARRE